VTNIRIILKYTSLIQVENLDIPVNHRLRIKYKEDAMSQIISNVAVIVILVVIVVLALKKTIISLKREMNGEGCASCGNRSSCQTMIKKKKSGSGGSTTESYDCCSGSGINYKPDKKAFKRFCKR